MSAERLSEYGKRISSYKLKHEDKAYNYNDFKQIQFRLCCIVLKNATKVKESGSIIEVKNEEKYENLRF